jgi:hypothetical protein
MSDPKQPYETPNVEEIEGDQVGPTPGISQPPG